MANPIAVGMDVGGTKVEIALVDAQGTVHRRSRRPTGREDGPDAVIREISESLESVIRDAADKPAGIGVGIAGNIEAGSGKVLYSPNLDWTDIPFGERLSEATDLSVCVCNDVRAAARGEWLYGAGRGCDDLVCVFVGTGVGGGVVSEGRLLDGPDNSFGEIGHMVIDLHGPACHCPGRGCLEALAGGWAVARRARQLARGAPERGESLLAKAQGREEDITAKIVSEAAGAGDELAKEIMEEQVAALIAGAVNLVNAFNPRRLIFGGGVIEGSPWMVDRIAEGVARLAMPVARRHVEVVKAALGGDAGVIGAASLVGGRRADPASE